MRVLWGEGMFLRPQHFQQQELFIDARMADALRLIHAHPWGVQAILVDSDALAAGSLQLNQLHAVFQDGVQFDAPSAEPLPLTRDLGDLPQLGVETIVYACLPALNAFGGNRSDRSADSAKPVRFHSAEVSVSDLYTDALETEISALRANVRLMLEPEDRDGHLSLAIARLVKNAAGVWSVDDSFIPPLVAMGGANSLHMLVRRLLDILLVKSQALANSHRERTKNIVEYGSSDIASFWLLHTVNRVFPLLNHMARFPQAHPEELYKTLAQFAGELLTFSSSLTLNEIPIYAHNDLTNTFQKLDALIRDLLDTVISSRYLIIPLTNTKPSFHIGKLESERLVDVADFYLSVSSELPAAQVIETVPYKLKVGAPDDVEKILNSALPGVRLSYAAQTPAPIPVRVGNHYFALEPHGAIYERMLKSHSVCIYVPQALIDFKLELIAVFR
jgi:type VI secretion system protein ImpJ